MSPERPMNPADRRPARSVGLALVVPVLVLGAGPGSAAADGTPWAGWTAEGPAGASYGSTASTTPHIAAGGDVTLATVQTAFTATDGRERVIGALPDGISATPATNPVVLPSGRLVAFGGTTSAVSDDLGRHWRTSTLPADVATAVGAGARTGPVFVDGRRGIVLADTPPVAYGTPAPAPADRTGPAVLATEDGGETWTVRRPAERLPATARSARPAVARFSPPVTPRAVPSATTRSDGAPAAAPPATPRTSDPGPPPPASRVRVGLLAALPGGTLVRTTSDSAADGRTGAALERSDDLGATWRPVALPVDFRAYPTPVVGAPGRTAGGAVVVPVGDALLVSTDDLATFTRVVPPGRAPTVLCDAAGSCLVDVDDPARAGRRLAVPFDGTTFGEPRPALPDGAVSPSPGVLVGTRRGGDGSADVVRSVDGGRSEASTGLLTGARVLPGGDPSVVVRQVGDQLRLTRDGVRWSTIPALPTAAAAERVAAAPGGLVVLTVDDRVWRWRSGAWSSWDASRVDPTDLAATDAGVVVIGERGVLRRADGRVRRTIRLSGSVVHGAAGPRLSTESGFTGVSARGRLVMVWTGDDERSSGDRTRDGGLLRSTDGGATWRHLPGARLTDDLQIASARTVFRTFGSGLYVSHDAGRRFVLINRIDGYGVDDEAPVAFQDARRGTVGSSVTTDGGRTLTPVLPDQSDGSAGSDPLLRIAGDGVLRSGPLESPLRSPALASAVRPRAVLHVAPRGRPDRSGSREVEVSGRVVGVPAGTRVRIVAAATRLAPRGGRGDTVLVTDERGAFRGRIGLGRRDRLLQVQVAASITQEHTILGAHSPWVRVPR